MVNDTAQGILPSQAIEDLVARGAIRIARALDADQVQPASLDLRLGTRAYRIRGALIAFRREQAELIQVEREAEVLSR